MPRDDAGQGFHLICHQDLARRVGGVADDDHPGIVGQFVDKAEIDRAIGTVGHPDDLGAHHRQMIGIQRIGRLREKDLVPRLDEREDRRSDAGGGAVGDHHLRSSGDATRCRGHEIR